MIWFNKRHQLAKCFESWAKENQAAICPLNVITWLLTDNMLNEENVLKYLDKKYKPRDEKGRFIKRS